MIAISYAPLTIVISIEETICDNSRPVIHARNSQLWKRAIARSGDNYVTLLALSPFFWLIIGCFSRWTTQDDVCLTQLFVEATVF